MKELHITLIGNTPSKKNSKRFVINSRTNKPMFISSKRYYEWERKNLYLLKSLQLKKVKYKPAYVYIDLYRDSRRRFDWNNISQAITDILVKAGILEDDSWEYCKPVFGEVFLDKENPRAEIKIKKK